MKLESTDLNLLVPLGALLSEKNVTKAAARIGVSQPTMSTALRRLRVHFSDELLIRHGAGYVLSPLAVILQGEVESILDSIERSFIARPTFSAATSNRHFRFMSSDFAVTVIAPELVNAVSQEAPSVRISFESIQPLARDDLVDRLLTVDFILMPREYDLRLPSVPLFRDKWICVTGVPRSEPLRAAEMADAEWVQVFGRAGHSLLAYEHVAMLVPDMGFRVSVDSFLMVPYAVAGTRRVGLMQQGLARNVPPSLDLYEVELDPPLPEIVEMAWWHPTREVDSGHLWMRGVLERLFGGDLQVS